MADLSLAELALELDNSATANATPFPQTSTAPTLPKCSDCHTQHIPRRLVICVDGTWMNEDGLEGASEDHTTNVFRIWLAVKKGEVEGKDGKLWYQIKKYIPGPGTSQPPWKKLWQGATGAGFATLIAHVYKYCVNHCCPSQDELFLFGYSRGAFIVRAVAGLYSHLGTLKHNIDSWDEKFSRAIDIYKAFRAKKETNPRKHADFHFLDEFTKPSPRIQFVGVFDTVKALNDNDLYDIRHTRKICHMRHALALLENQNSFKLERIVNEDGIQLPASGHKRTCLEAWFLGFHSNIGGGCRQDGLALWPLQWILSEASEYGLVLEFLMTDKRIAMDLKIDDPIAYTMPPNEGPHQISFNNGATVKMWDLNQQFAKPKFKPIISYPSGLTTIPGTSERAIFEQRADFQAMIIHPSLHWMDDMTPLGIESLNPLACSNQVRQQFKDILGPPERLYWNQHYARIIETSRNKVRVLVCGPSGVGKSSLINEVLRCKMSPENSDPSSVQHDIDLELSNPGSKTRAREFIFHDATGFERGLDETSAKVETFLKRRENMTAFDEQLHCIWYCYNSTGRLAKADFKFFQSIKFCRLPIIFVLTKYDELESDCRREACREYRQTRPDEPQFHYNKVPLHAQDAIEARQSSLIKSRYDGWDVAVNGLSMGQSEICAVSIEYENQVENLCNRTLACQKNDMVLRIHNRSMVCYLEQTLPQVVDAVTNSTEEAISKLNKIFHNHSISIDSDDGPKEWLRVLNEFRQRLLQELPSLYGIKVAQELQFNDYRDLFTQLYQGNKAPSWWKDHPQLEVNEMNSVGTAFLGAGMTTAIFRGMFMVPFGPSVVFPGAIAGFACMGMLMWRLLNPTSNQRDQEWLEKTLQDLLVQSACLILLYERLFWLGFKGISSRELIARAAIEVLKLGAEIEQAVHDFKARDLNEFSDVLTKLVGQMRKELGIVSIDV